MRSYGFYQPETIDMVKDIPTVPVDKDYVKRLQDKFTSMFPDGKPKCKDLNGSPILSWC